MIILYKGRTSARLNGMSELTPERRRMLPAIWQRTKTRLRDNAEELRDHGWTVIEPANFDTHPLLRSPDTCAIVQADTQTEG